MDDFMKKWKQSETWLRRGKDFSIEVRHSIEVRPDEVAAMFSDGPHRWFVYAYIYPKHPRFQRFDGDQLWQEAANELPLHSGCSFLHRNGNGLEVFSIQVGADYHHYGDDGYTFCENSGQAYSVFRDADELFAFLESEAG